MSREAGLEGRVALVTGGTSGIGKACVSRFRAEGMTVTFTGRDVARGEAVAREAEATFIQCDHRSREASDRAVEEALELGGGRLDVLVANAGILFQGSIEATPEAVFRELLEVNLTSLFRISRAGFGAMREAGGGSMIHIASDAGMRAVHEIAAYSVTKAGVIAVSELFGAEGAPHGIRANAVCPGDIVPGVQATPAGHPDHAENPAGWVLPPSGRFGRGEDVAGLVAWLASDESAHMTGATLRIDGGTGAAMRVATRG
ncbi:MAG: SDR family oxidoreductase [Actinomycetota bacterium]|nr:SDR family oxidoreductase [Actinomycetota bacterium]